MTLAVAEAVKYAIASGFRRVHLSTGTDVSKTRWRPEPIPYRDLMMVSPCLRGRFARRLLDLKSSVEQSPYGHVLRRLIGRRHHLG